MLTQLWQLVTEVSEILLLKKMEKKHRWLKVMDYFGLCLLAIGAVLTVMYS